MTKRDFELIARVLKEARAKHAPHLPTHDRIARAMANALAHTNPLFDRQRFLKACTGEE